MADSKIPTVCSTPLLFPQTPKVLLSPGQKVTAFMQHKRSVQAQHLISRGIVESPQFCQELLEKVQKSLHKSASRPEVRQKSITQQRLELTRLRDV